jgi:hypothetical protein
MDIYSSIAIALALGAAAGIKSTAEQAIKDCYSSIKALIKKKYPRIDLTILEDKPESESRRKVIAEDLAEVDAAKDKELLEKVGKLLETLNNTPIESHESIGVKLDDIEALSLTIRDVLSSGSGIVVNKSRFSGDINLQGIKAGQKPAKKTTDME